jgi:glc operon protein GlcG
MKTRIITLALGLLASAALPALLRAQEVDTRHSLTMDGAKKVAEAAVAFARSNGASPSIAVVDEGGHLLYFVRLDGSFVAGANVSIGKARTSATFKKPTKEFEDIVNKGRFTMTTLPDFTPLQGGLPILHENHVVGAIGVSGAKSAAQDEEVAKAGADALAGRKLANAQ